MKNNSIKYKEEIHPTMRDKKLLWQVDAVGLKDNRVFELANIPLQQF